MTVPLIDAHHHLWDPARHRLAWLPESSPLRRRWEIHDLAADAAHSGVTLRGTVAVQADPDLAETTDLLAAATGSPLILGVVGWADLSDPDIADTLRWLRRQRGGARLCGIRYPTSGDVDLLADPAVRAGMAAVGRSGLTVELLVTPAALSTAARLASRLGDVPTVLDHMGGATSVTPQWVDGLAQFAEAGQTYVKVSGRGLLAPDARAMVQQAAALFGPQRLMYGSDWPLTTSSTSYREVLSRAEAALAGLPLDDAFAGTASAAYRLAESTDEPLSTAGER